MSNNNSMRRRGPMGGRRGMAPGEKAKDLKGTMIKLIKYMRRFYVPIVMVIIFAIASTVFNIVGPTILGDATTEIFKGLVRKVSGGSGIDFDKVTHILLMLLSLYVASAIFSFIQGLIMTHVSNNVSYQMRKDISEKIHRMPMKYFESRTYGEVLSRVTNDVDTLGQSLNQSMTQIITSTTQIVGVFIMMIRISIPMTIAVLLTLPLSMGLIGLIMSKSQPYFKAQQKHLGELNGQVEEIYSGHNIVKAFNKEESVIEEFKEVNGKLYNSAWRSQFFSGAMMPLMQFVGNLGYVAVTILGGYLAIKKTIEVGQIQSFLQYVRKLAPLSFLRSALFAESSHGSCSKNSSTVSLCSGTAMSAEYTLTNVCSSSLLLNVYLGSTVSFTKSPKASPIRRFSTAGEMIFTVFASVYVTS